MRLCVDSGFLIALYEGADQHHRDASEKFIRYFEDSRNRLLVPWPILYEAIGTRFTRRPDRMRLLYRHWSALRLAQRLDLLDDREARQQALDDCFGDLGSGRYRSLSLVDRVIRRLLSTHRIEGFITFDPGDFADVCRSRRIELL